MDLSLLIPIYQATHRAIIQTLDRETKKVIAEYNNLAMHKFPKQYPQIKRYYINITILSHNDSMTATIIAIPENPKLAEFNSNEEVDVVDNIFHNLIKKYLPNQKNFTVRGNIQMSIFAQPFNPNR